MNKYLLVAGLLGELSAELQRLERWQSDHPGEEALASTLPFCVDTLSFDQWLQFVLIPRMEQLVMLQAPLPANVSLYPMASESYKENLAEVADLLRLIARFDLLLSGKVVEK
ncbi:YqcC family protein [Aeromonas bivalvium]|uniref:YqcC family protein n=1 Tax=Aeromonas TaxID=642 RepID=UPI0038CF935C